MRKTIIKSSGFTLVEIIIAVTIIAVLAAAGIGVYGRDVVRARASADVYNARQLATAISRAYIDGQLKNADGTLNTAYFSDTTKIRLYSTGGIGQRLLTLNYISEPAVFNVKGKQRENWQFGYTLTRTGLVNIYVCQNSWSSNNFTGSQFVQLYPSIPAGAIKPYDMVINN